jgi:DNA-binding transcriptional regulator GbsR (MarR family)
MPSSEIRQFIERMGLAFERLGLPRSFGRVLGLLMVAEGPLSLDDMVERLHVSKATASISARSCENFGMARRVGIRGDRKDYYEIAPDAFESVMALEVSVLHSLAGLAAEGLEAVGAEPTPARGRLSEMLDFYLFMGEQVEELLERWKEVKR